MDSSGHRGHTADRQGELCDVRQIRRPPDLRAIDVWIIVAQTQIQSWNADLDAVVSVVVDEQLPGVADGNSSGTEQLARISSLANRRITSPVPEAIRTVVEC